MGMAKEQVRPHRESGRGKGRRHGCGRGHGRSEESHWRGWGRGNQLGGRGVAWVGSRGRHGDAGRGLGHGDKGVGVIDGGGAATEGGGSGLDGDYNFFL